MDISKIVDRYSYRVVWSAEDGEHVELCAEFPSLSWLAGSQIGALKGIRKVVLDVLRDMQKNGEGIPTPLSRCVSRHSCIGSWSWRQKRTTFRSTASSAPNWPAVDLGVSYRFVCVSGADFISSSNASRRLLF